MRICILGATGLVGRELLHLLPRAWPGCELDLYASRDQALEVEGRHYAVRGANALDAVDATGGQLAFVALDDEHSARYVPRLRAQFDKEIRGKLVEQFGYTNALQVPVLEKVVLNMGIGEAVNDRKKVELAAADLALIAGQKPVVTHSRKAIATFKLREGQAIGAKVTAIAKRPDGWQVTSAAGTFTGRMLVNAAGAWVDEVAKLAGITPLGFTPNRRSMARIPAPGGHDVSKWPMIFGPGEDWYAKPDAGALIVSPAEEHPMDPHDAWADDMVLAEGLARYEEMMTEPVTRLISNWAGLRTFAPDRVLVIGPDLREPSFFWIAGQGGYGFQTSPAASRLVADLIGGRAPEIDADLVAQLSPARFG